MVLAYSKIWLSNHLLDSDLPDDPYFASEVQRYFPAPDAQALFARDSAAPAAPRNRRHRRPPTAW